MDGGVEIIEIFLVVWIEEEYVGYWCEVGVLNIDLWIEGYFDVEDGGLVGMYGEVVVSCCVFVVE